MCVSKRKLSKMLNDDLAGTTVDILNSTYESYTEQNVAATSNFEANSIDGSLAKITPTIQGLSDLFQHTFRGVTYKQCTEWQSGTQHMYFHAANALLLIAFLIPYKPLYSFLCGRCFFTFACLLMAMFHYLIECSIDGVVWYAILSAVNFCYVIVLMYQLRPIRFDKEIEEVNKSI